MGNCKCGCGEFTRNNRNFIPGHDQKLRSQIEAEAGSIFAVQDIIAAAKYYSCGAITSGELTTTVREIFDAKSI